MSLSFGKFRFLFQQSFENCVTQSEETLEKKQRLCESSRIDSPTVSTNTVQRTNGDILQQKVQNTGWQSPNSSVKSFDVDLSEMTPKKNTKHIGSNSEMTKGEFKVPLHPPPKRRSIIARIFFSHNTYYFLCKYRQLHFPHEWPKKAITCLNVFWGVLVYVLPVK